MFICFEGIDGAGKSTQARMLQQKLIAEGYKVELVADPGTTQIGTAIRQILLHNDSPITPIAQMLLFSAARAELADYIARKVKSKHIIVCDRWLLSTLVYQGELNHIPARIILDIFRAANCQFPDFCFLLDLPPEDAKKRAGPARDRYERRTLAERRRMRDAYLKWAKESLADCTPILDARQAPNNTHEQIYTVVKSALKKCRYVPKRMEARNARNGSARNRRPAPRARVRDLCCKKGSAATGAAITR